MAAENLALQQELADMVFPDCGLRHERLNDEVQKTYTPLPIYSTQHQSLCSVQVRKQRPTCPHFPETYEGGNDPYVRVMHYLMRERVLERESLDAYREKRKLLYALDEAIRTTRENIHYVRRVPNASQESVYCASILDTFAKSGQLVPMELLRVQTLNEMEREILELHARIREKFEELTLKLKNLLKNAA